MFLEKYMIIEQCDSCGYVRVPLVLLAPPKLVGALG